MTSDNNPKRLDVYDLICRMTVGNPSKVARPLFVVLAVIDADNAIGNGGFEKFYFNSWPEYYEPYSKFSDAFRAIGAQEAGACIDQTTAEFPFKEPHLDRERRLEYMATIKDLPWDDNHPFHPLSVRFHCLAPDTYARMIEYVWKHQSHFPILQKQIRQNKFAADLALFDLYRNGNNRARHPDDLVRPQFVVWLVRNLQDRIQRSYSSSGGYLFGSWPIGHRYSEIVEAYREIGASEAADCLQISFELLGFSAPATDLTQHRQRLDQLELADLRDKTDFGDAFRRLRKLRDDTMLKLDTYVLENRSYFPSVIRG